MDAARRTAVGVGSFAALELALGIWVLSAVGSVRIGLFVTVCALATAALAVGLDRLLKSGPPPPGGDGGTGPAPATPPDPSWWPEFERELEAYAASRGPRDPSATR